MPRVQDIPNYMSRRRPHLNLAEGTIVITCYCYSCDDKIEQSLPTRLSEFCNCDQYVRWICLPCKVKEDKPEEHYITTRTKVEWGIDEQGSGMQLYDHQSYRAVRNLYSFHCLSLDLARP